jgi:hypothetical protein
MRWSSRNQKFNGGNLKNAPKLKSLVRPGPQNTSVPKRSTNGQTWINEKAGSLIRILIIALVSKQLTIGKQYSPLSRPKSVVASDVPEGSVGRSEESPGSQRLLMPRAFNSDRSEIRV